MAGKSFLDRAAAYTYEELDRLGGDLSKPDVSQQTVAILYSEQAILITADLNTCSKMTCRVPFPTQK
jgi:hypothetical protein